MGVCNLPMAKALNGFNHASSKRRSRIIEFRVQASASSASRTSNTYHSTHKEISCLRNLIKTPVLLLKRALQLRRRLKTSQRGVRRHIHGRRLRGTGGRSPKVSLAFQGLSLHISIGKVRFQNSHQDSFEKIDIIV